MCGIFVNAAPDLAPDPYAARAHSIRLHGAVTSIRLENQFWQVLEDIAAQNSISLNGLITQLHDELMLARGRVDNFASFLRVSCLRYQLRKFDVSLPVPTVTTASHRPHSN